MMGTTHAMGGAAVWLAGCAIFAPPPVVVGAGMGLALAGSLAPDVDHGRAHAAQACRAGGAAAIVSGLADWAAPQPGVPWPLLVALGAVLALLPWATRPRRGGFRGIVHSQWGIAACLALSFVPVAFGLPVWAGLAFTAGWGSHLALDAVTAEGLRLRWPDQTRYGWFPKASSMRTGGRRPGRAGKGPVGREYVIVQPALWVACIGLGWLVLMGGRL